MQDTTTKKKSILVKIGIPFYRLVKENLSIIFTWFVITIIAGLLKSKISDALASLTILTDKEVSNPPFNSWFVTGCILIVLYFGWLIFKNYRLSNKSNFCVFLLVIIYNFLRNDNLDSVRFSTYKGSIYYADVLYLLSILTLVLILRNVYGKNWVIYDRLVYWINNLKPETEEKLKSYLVEDLPHDKTLEHDYEKLIDEVILAIDNLHSQSSFIIGINSIWGVGKTSFLQRLEYKLKEGRDKKIKSITPITIWFNVWQHQDEKLIVNNFFNQLKKELSKFSGNSKNSIDNYLKEMLALIDNKLIGSLKSLTDNIFSDADTIKDFYNEINTIIESINRKVIVFVDDLDRLNKNEILETLRILRNIAGFKNMVFICGLDRDYVVLQSQIDNYFLDKIFNLEINLTTQKPKNHIKYLIFIIQECDGLSADEKKLLNNSIKQIFNYDNKSNRLDEFFDSSQKEEPNITSNELTIIQLSPELFFETKRDVKKFFNELYINIKTLKKLQDIELDNYMLLKLLMFKYKWMYKHFSSKRISLWLGNSSKLQFADNNLDRLSMPVLNHHDKNVVFSILKQLFSDSSGKRIKGINQKRYFPIYLNNNLYDEAFSFTELISAIDNNTVSNLINDKVVRDDDENLLKEDIKDHMLDVQNIQSEDNFIQIINLIKEDHLGYVDDIEILNIIYLGETNYFSSYSTLLENSIFTNFSDHFASFIRELNSYYAQTLIKKSFSTHTYGGVLNQRKINALKTLNKLKVNEILLKILPTEIENNRNNLKELGRISTFFQEYDFSIFAFSLFYKNYQRIIINFFTDNFETIFLENTPIEVMRFFDPVFLANVYDDNEQREKIIQQATHILNTKKQFSANDLIIEDYIKNGMNNFIDWVNSIRSKITEENIEKYSIFIEWMLLYKSNDYKYYPNK